MSRFPKITSGVTLAGYTGSITVGTGGGNTDAVTFNGNAANLLTVSATPAAPTTDQDRCKNYEHGEAHVTDAQSHNSAEITPNPGRVLRQSALA